MTVEEIIIDAPITLGGGTGGLTPISSVVDPTVLDIEYPVGQTWVNTVSGTVFTDTTAIGESGWVENVAGEGMTPIASASDPTASDDGYDVGQTWVNINTNKVFTDTLPIGSANWVELAQQEQLDNLDYRPRPKHTVEDSVELQPGIPVIQSVATIISTNDGDDDYNSWPSIEYWEARDVFIGVWRRGAAHAGDTTGQIMLSTSPDGVTWDTPVVLFTNESGDRRDAELAVFEDRVHIYNCVVNSWAPGGSAPSEVYESFDLETWDMVGQIDASGDSEGSLPGVYTWAVVNGAGIISDGQEILASGFESNTTTSGDSFYRSVLWASSDMGRNWTLRSVIRDSEFSNPSDVTTLTAGPNETTIAVWQGKLLAFSRVEISGELYRSESSDMGRTWDSQSDVNPGERRGAKPYITISNDGRFFLSQRYQRLNQNPTFTQIHVSSDGGNTWPELVVGHVEFSEYESSVIRGSTMYSIAGGDTDISGTASDIYSWQYDIDQSPSPGFAPPSPTSIRSLFDGDGLAFDGTASTYKSSGFNWTQSDPTRYGTVAGGPVDDRPVIEFPGNYGLDTGATGDHNYMHNGDNFTIGLRFRVDSYSSTTYLAGTSRSSGGHTGLAVWSASGPRVNFSVSNGSSIFLSYTSGPNVFVGSTWTSWMLRYDGTNYEVFYNGRLVDSIPTVLSHSAGDHQYPLYIGQSSAGDLARDDTAFRRAFFYDSALSDDDMYRGHRWLSK